MTERGGIIKIISFEGGAFIYSTKAAQDRRLSLAARGLLTELASRPPNWKTSVTELAEGNDLSLPTIRKLINELIAFGYCKRWQARDENGRRGPVNFAVCLDPDKLEQTIETDCGRAQKNREAVSPLSGKISTTNKRPSTNQRQYKAPLLQGVPTPSVEGGPNFNGGGGGRSVSARIKSWAEGLGCPVDQLEKSALAPSIASPSAYFAARCVKWLSEQEPRVDAEVWKGALRTPVGYQMALHIRAAAQGLRS